MLNRNEGDDRDMLNEDLNTQLELIARNAIPFTGDDTVMRDGWREIAIGSGYVMRVTEALWSAWTGRRFLNGEEYHGPVYKMGTNVLYTGSRSCQCRVCGETVPVGLRAN